MKDCSDKPNEGKGEDMKGFGDVEGVILEDSRMWVRVVVLMGVEFGGKERRVELW
jgi:hypothetical protein